MMYMSPEEREAIVEFGGEVKGRPPELKTYIMESNNGLAEIRESNTLMVSHVQTNLPEVSILTLKWGGKSAVFYVDATDPRFLVLYTNELAETTDILYERLVMSPTNRFDKIWLPTNTLKDIVNLAGNVFGGFGTFFEDYFVPEKSQPDLSMSVTGLKAIDVLNVVQREKKLRRSLSYSKIRVFRGNSVSSVTDEIRYTGRIITVTGDSVDDHVSLVERIRKIYKDLIEDIERSSIGTKKVENRTLIKGRAFDLILDREIENLDQFLDRLLSSTSPFRLWGLRSKISKNMQKIAVVDLHTGDPLDLEITPSLIRIYLPEGSCGNTILRLYVNLQHSFDSAIKFNGEKQS